ncbi:hypothetical protein Pcinc_041790 [Petrolisthes cinctipes]|uniref:Lysosomal enzyme trafficking factor n=1 Tax=Petrolisthes cinctipes TaxID=88211 RepID=A0AAE1BJJ4_PETCI|nr:hypothetical protein Pcinc_041790 [Petrolisthes cinctipes]
MNFRQRIAWICLVFYLATSIAMVYYFLDIADQYAVFSLEHSKLHQGQEDTQLHHQRQDVKLHHQWQEDTQLHQQGQDIKLHQQGQDVKLHQGEQQDTQLHQQRQDVKLHQGGQEDTQLYQGGQDIQPVVPYWQFWRHIGDLPFHVFILIVMNMGSDKDLSQVTIAQIIALKKPDFTTKEIAEQVGVCEQSVRCWVAKLYQEGSLVTATKKTRPDKELKTGIRAQTIVKHEVESNPRRGGPILCRALYVYLV